MKALNRIRARLGLCFDADAAQIVELAVSLPLLAVLFVGTYDFGQAFNFKQKLVATTREAARLAANQPTTDLSDSSTGNCSAPASICAIRDLIHTNLQNNNMDDCGLGSTNANTTTTWTFEFDASTGCGGNTFQVVINRGYPYNVNSNFVVEATQVRMSYPYQWQFNRVIQVLIPSANYAAVMPIGTSAVMQNLN